MMRTRPPSTNQLMRLLLLALLPGTAVLTLYYGLAIWFNLLIANASALTFEAICLKLRQKDISATLNDGSAIVTATLLCLCLPSSLGIGEIIFGVFMAIVIAKHCFGGLGQNIFNPAMVGYCALLISFPVAMTQWPMIEPNSVLSFDAVTGATPLDHFKTDYYFQHQPLAEVVQGMANWLQPLCYLNLAWLVGGLFLIWRRVMSWQIPVAVITATVIAAVVHQLIYPQASLSVITHLLTGATVFGALFIATDPVTASTTPWGKILFGLGVGLLCFIIRQYSSYPDGFAFAILLMNILAPMLDRLTQPKLFGER